MGYKVLGYLVWKGARWYLRRRFRGAGRKALIIGGAGVVAAAGAAALIARRQPKAS